jgi:NAD dependent epimerase/dehydratase family enzyme
MFGEMSATFLEGSRISNQKLLDHGFTFEFPELGPALKDLIQ